MPAVLKPEAWPVWLGEQPADVPQLKALLAPYPFRGHDLLAGERARRQRQKNNDAGLIEPVVTASRASDPRAARARGATEPVT